MSYSLRYYIGNHISQARHLTSQRLMLAEGEAVPLSLWTNRSSKVLVVLATELEEANIHVIPTVTSRGKLFESFVFFSLLKSLVKSGYMPVSESTVCDLNFENSLPYRQLTRASHSNLQVPYDELERVLVPKLSLRRGNSTLNIFYQGYPFGRGRQRPDITVLQGQLTFSRSIGIFGEARPKIEYVCADSRVSLVIRPVCDTLGPVFENALQVERISPDLILEVFTGKTERRFREQMLLYSAYQPRFLGYVTRSKVRYPRLDKRFIIRCDGLEVELNEVPRLFKEVSGFINRLPVS